MRITIIAAGLVAAIAAPAMSANISIFTDRAAFEAAIGSFTVETFDDGTVDAPVSVVSDFGSVSGGLWADRVDNAEQTVWSFATAVTGFGGDWDMSPGGFGTGVQLTLNFAGGGSQAVSSEIPNNTVGFWGVTSDMAFTSVLVSEGADTGGGRFRETHDFDNLTTAPVPLPAAGWLMIAGLGALAATRARRA